MRKGTKSKRVIAAFALVGALALGGFAAAPLQALATSVTLPETTELEDVATLTVNYRIGKDDGNMIAESYIAEMPVGSKYSVDSPEIEGFVLANSDQAVVSGEMNTHATINVIYNYEKDSVPYAFEFIGVDSNGNQETLATGSGTAAPGETVKIPSRAFEGYAQRTEDMSLVVTPDGKAKKTVYYEKAEGTVYVLFNTNGSYVVPVAMTAGDKLADNDKLGISFETVPTRAGWEFDGWDYNGDKIGSVSDLPEVMPASDIILNATWKPGTSSYTVEFYFENANDSGYTWDKTLNETRTATTSSTVTATQADMDLADEQIAIDAGTYDEYQQGKFYGFDYDHCEDATVNDDGSGVLRLYYKRETWTVYLMDNLVATHSYDRSYLTGLEEFNGWEKVVWKKFSGKYGSSLPGDFPTNDELMTRAMELRKTADEKYQNSSLKYAGHTQVYTGTDGHGGTFDDDDELRHASWCSFGYFDTEDKDKPGSHALHAYPALSEGTYNFYITWKGEKLGVNGEVPDDFETVYARIAGPLGTNHDVGFVAPKIEGFTYVGGAMQSYYERDFCNTGIMYSPPVTGFQGDVHGPGCTDSNVLKVEENDNWDSALQACWLDTDAHLNLTTGETKRLIVAQYTTYFLRREKYDVNFVSVTGGENETVLRAVEDVYYEQPLSEVPMADGQTENILAYVPSVDQTPEGMTFDGWYTSSDTSDPNNAVAADATMPAGELTLYAKWKPKDVTVTFDSCGGSDVASQTVAYNSKATLPEEPTRDGYEFMGWFTEEIGGDRWGFDNTVGTDITLYAHWRGSNEGTFTVHHVMEGATEPFTTETVKGVKGVTVTVEALVPQDAGYPKDAYLKPDFAQKSQTITGDPEKDIVTFTYVPASQRTYTVKYLERGTEKALRDPKSVTTSLSYVTERAVDIADYTVDHPWIAQAVKKSGDVITFYYSGPGGGGGTETPEITLTPQDMVAYTGGDSLGGDSFPATRYLVKASGGANLSNLKFTVDGKTYTLPEGTKSGDVVVLPWLPDVFTFEDGSEFGASDVVEGTSVTNDLAAGDYTISVDKTKVTVSAGAATVAFGTGDLIVRDVSDPEAVIKDEVDIAQPVLSDADSVDTSDGIGVAVVDDATSYYTNGDEELQLLGDTESDEPQISLLFDMLLPGEEGEDTADLLRERASKEGYELTDENSVFRYLDLVNENDGNAWVSTDDGVEIKIYWPVPEGVDPDGVEFSVLHFEDLHRQYRENLDEQIRDCDVVRIDDVSVDETGENVVFTLVGDQDEGCFSPFALTWSPTGDGPSEPDPGEPDTPDTPDTPEDPDTPDEPGEPDKPGEPGEPSEPSEPAKPSKPSRPETAIPQTGDLLGAIAPLVGLAGAGTLCAGTVLNRRRKKR